MLDKLRKTSLERAYAQAKRGDADALAQLKRFAAQKTYPELARRANDKLKALKKTRVSPDHQPFTPTQRR